VPEPISRRVLDASLADYYGADLSLLIEGIEINDVSACNLSDTDSSGTTWAHTPPQAPVAVDPVLGRISFRDAQPEPPRVMFHYGFSGAMGGGEYERTPSFDAALGPVTAVDSGGSIQAALDARTGGGVVELSDSGRFEETLNIALDPAVRMEFRAANEHRPTLILGSPLDLTGGANAEVTLNGVLLAGAPMRILSALGDTLRKVRLLHCTLVPGLSLGIDGTPDSPGAPSLLIEHTETPIEIEIDHCIMGAIHAPPNATVLIRHSIVDANNDTAMAYSDLDGARAGGTVSMVNSTIIGRMHTGLLKLASNSIFLSRTEDGSAPIRSERRQTGCVRFSWAPLEARVPRRYRCQPELEIAERVQAAIAKSGTNTISDVERQAINAAVAASVVPAFTSVRYTDPGYCQLRLSVPEQIRSGADDQAEMGAFHDLFQPQRESNIRARLREYLRFGLEAGVFYET
jgi:hypothetical protein